MRTVLSDFANAFQADFRPYLERVSAATEALAETPEDTVARKLLPTLQDSRHQMQALIDKVAEQQAYVLIFGPIKSGKSTFMNALCGAYVSEVTSLPAYPCMVYVKHSDTPDFEVTHYDGQTTSFTRRDALHEVVTAGHLDLTENIREVEARGEAFDPAVHMPHGLRRVDVGIAIDDLADSGAVLVDTPGLYTRMKFGYEQMTRDFRDSAACAIFIVKADNLFLEQVFDEFTELLELFSRIFLVVNIDSTKMDLKPDGTLGPSLEQTSPWEVVQAFEDLSMTSPLKQAFEAGRLEIYPVDLLQAASRRILGEPARADAERSKTATDDAAEADREATRESRAADNADRRGSGRGQADFDEMLHDLIEYLNSNEYLTAFVDDSLRRSRTLVAELQVALGEDHVQMLHRDVDSLHTDRDLARAQIDRVERLQKVAWRDQARSFTPSVQQHVARRIAEVRTDAFNSVDRLLDQWFENAHSLAALEQDLAGIVRVSHTRLVAETEQALEPADQNSQSLLVGTAQRAADLEVVGVDLREVAATARERLETSRLVEPSRPRFSVEKIPIRRRLIDWLLFRSGQRLGRHVFGPPDQRDKPISVTDKGRRFNEEGRQALRGDAFRQLETRIDEAAGTLPDLLVGDYAERIQSGIQARLEALHAEATQRFEHAEHRLGQLERADETLRDLTDQLALAAASVGALVERFGSADAALEAGTAAGASDQATVRH